MEVLLLFIFWNVRHIEDILNHNTPILVLNRFLRIASWVRASSFEKSHLYNFNRNSVIPIFSGTILAANGLTLEGHSTEKASILASQIRTLQDVLSRFNALRVDATEYACLKALVLFKSGMCHVSSLQENQKYLNILEQEENRKNWEGPVKGHASRVVSIVSCVCWGAVTVYGKLKSTENNFTFQSDKAELPNWLTGKESTHAIVYLQEMTFDHRISVWQNIKHELWDGIIEGNMMCFPTWFLSMLRDVIEPLSSILTKPNMLNMTLDPCKNNWQRRKVVKFSKWSPKTHFS